MHDVSPEIRDAFAAAYTGGQRLSGGFEYYRAMPANGRQIAELAASGRLTVPTLAVGGSTTSSVGGALALQLDGVADHLTSHVLPDVGHIIPLDGLTVS